MRLFVNFVAFQFGWFACVLGAAWGLPWAGTAIVVAIVVWHLSRAAQPRREANLVLAAAVIGALWDSLLSALGWIEFPTGVLITSTAPYWMVALWMLLATTLNLSLAWLKRQLFIAAALGAVGGPLAYYGGATLGALVFVEQTAALAALAVGWALLTPLLLSFAQRHDGFVDVEKRLLQSEMRHD